LIADKHKRGFGPLMCSNPRFLILGSLPGDASIRAQQYYAHPQNQFWRILAAVYDQPPCTTYDEKLSLLSRNHIAVWDVLEYANRVGSLDTAIRDGSANDVAKLLVSHPTITSVACNGKTAHQLFLRHVASKVQNRRPAIVLAALPSTSPAATKPFAEKVREWQSFLTANGEQR
jgi:double-stranded uracil-DNA glycosylase